MKYVLMVLLLAGCVTKPPLADVKEIRVYMTSDIGLWCAFRQTDGKSCSYIYYPSDLAMWSVAEGHIYVTPESLMDRVPYEKCRLAGYDSYPCPVDVDKLYHRVMDLDALYKYPGKYSR